MTVQPPSTPARLQSNGRRRKPALASAAFLLVALMAALAGAHCGGDGDAPSQTPGGNSAPGNASPTPAATASLQGDAAGAAMRTARANLPLDLANGYFLGSPEAPITLTIYEDFQCPHCLRYVAGDEPAIVEEYVKTGKVQLQFQHLPILGVESARAALGGHCASDQNRFWEYHNALFTLQADEGQLSDEKLNVGRFSEEALVVITEDLGLDSETFAECVASAAAQDAILSQVAEAQEIGLRGTPSFLINGVPLTGTPRNLEAWRSLLDR